MTARKFFIFKKDILVIFVFAILVGLFYGNTLKNGFVHDDIGQVVQNEYVHSLRYLPKTVTGCTWEYVFGGCKDSSYYRPLHSLSYLLTYQISPRPWFFHLINLFYFFATVFLVFILIKKLTKNFILSFLTALFFLIHPINNEAVAWIASVPELVYTIFLLLSTIFFIKYREKNAIKDFILCSIFYFLAILSKEPAVFLPIIFAFIDWRLFNIKLIYYLPQVKEEAPKEEDDLDLGIRVNFKEAKKYFIFLAICLLFLLMRIVVLGGIIGPRQLYFGVFSIQERIYAFFSLFGQYLIKLFYPHPLLFFYYFEKSANFLSPEFIISSFLIIIFFTAIYFLIKKEINLPALFLIWLFIFLSPVLFFVYSAGENVFSERYLFASTIGFSLLLANVFYYFWKKKKVLRSFLLLIIVLMVAGSWSVIYPRNKIFQSDETLYKATLVLNPKAHAIRRNFAAELMAAGEYEKAKPELEKIIQIAPDWWEIDKVYNQLGDYYRMIGDFYKTVEYYEKAIEVSGYWNYKPYNNLGALYMEKEEYLKALTYLCKAIQLGPDAPEVNNNFNRIVLIIDSIDSQEGLKELYSDITLGEVFKESKEEKIKYMEIICEKDLCAFLFLSRTGEREVLFPFLILASTSQNEILKIKNRSFNPEMRAIGLEIDSKYKDQNLTFIFPTCDGIYYKAQAIPQ